MQQFFSFSAAMLFAVILASMCALQVAGALPKLGTCYDVEDKCLAGNGNRNGAYDVYGDPSLETSLEGRGNCAAFISSRPEKMLICRCHEVHGCPNCDTVDRIGACVNVGDSAESYFTIAPAYKSQRLSTCPEGPQSLELYLIPSSSSLAQGKGKKTFLHSIRSSRSTTT
ncbi:unnamed protein product [Parajaminaea phylloscopi]